MSSAGQVEDAPEDLAADSVLAAEQAHLSSSRRALATMREQVLALPAMGADRVSTEYLKAELYHRAEALRDDPDAALFFGRLDYLDGLGDGDRDGSDRPGSGRDGIGDDDGHEAHGGDGPVGDGSGEDGPGGHFYVGRRHVHDAAGDPMVIDWRAPISRPFYRASPTDPMGLRRRRRFGFSGGALTAYEDEFLSADSADSAGSAGSAAADPAEAGGEGGAASRASRILVEEIERPRVGPMRDIVATIQPDQDDIVRADADETVCVQGAPGTGKTAVGLHRVAYLLYAQRERMRRGGMLVIGPSSSFLGYIRGVLPALGEVDVRQTTMERLLAAVPVNGVDTVEAARVKGDGRMAQLLSREVWGHLREPAEALVLPRGARRWRVPAFEITELVEGLRARGVRYGAGRDLLSHRIAHAVLSRLEVAGEPCDDRTHEAVRRSRPVRALVDEVWPKLDPVRVVMRLLSDPERLAVAADGLLDPAEQQAVAWAKPARGPKSAPWTRADAVLVDEVADLISRTPSLGHVVVDEAQDLSPMAARAIGRRCSTGSATVLGDIAQGTTPYAAEDWPTLLAHLGKGNARLQVLDRGYRVPRQIIDFASRLLPSVAPGLRPPTSVRQAEGALEVRPVSREELPHAVVAACRESLAGVGSVGLIVADAQVPALADGLDAVGLGHVRLGAAPGAAGTARRRQRDAGPGGAGPGDTGPGTDLGDTGRDDFGAARLVVVPASQAKGLEFDHVVAVEPAAIVAAEPRGLRRLYVVLTRAVSRLCVIHAEPLPGPLAGPDGPTLSPRAEPRRRIPPG